MTLDVAYDIELLMTERTEIRQYLYKHFFFFLFSNWNKVLIYIYIYAYIALSFLNCFISNNIAVQGRQLRKRNLK